MKTITKSALLAMLIAMFMWGCGDNGGKSNPVVNENNNTEECLAKPACPEGYEITEQCPQDACCQEATLCGTTIQCWSDDAIVCPVPGCPEGTKPVDESKCGNKEDGLLECEIVYGGMDPQYCVENCPVEIACPDGLDFVAQCPQGDGYCESVTICSETIQCWKAEPLNCTEIMMCPEGMTQVELGDCSTNEDASGADCQPITLCGGETFYCAELVDNCSAVPSCPDDLEQVDVCPEDSECEEVTVCGHTIQCLKMT